VRYRYVDPAGHMTFAYAFLAYLRDAKMRPVGERAQYKIRVVERGLPCDVVRDGDAAKARLLCRADARGRILERERFRCRNVEQRQRLQIERGLIRRRFRIRTDDRIPRVAQTDAAAVALDPLVPVAGNDPSLEHQALGLSETLLDTREQGRGVTELELALRSAADQRLPIELPTRERFQMRDRIEGPRDRSTRSDRRQPVAQGEVDPVLFVDITPRLIGRNLGVDDDAIEVEEERADQNPLKLPPTPRTTEGRTPAPRTPLSRSKR
jgi:hypothetical protein